jgi:hypothetical protein
MMSEQITKPKNDTQIKTTIDIQGPMQGLGTYIDEQGKHEYTYNFVIEENGTLKIGIESEKLNENMFDEIEQNTNIWQTNDFVESDELNIQRKNKTNFLIVDSDRRPLNMLKQLRKDGQHIAIKIENKKHGWSATLNFDVDIEKKAKGKQNIDGKLKTAQVVFSADYTSNVDREVLEQATLRGQKISKDLGISADIAVHKGGRFRSQYAMDPFVSIDHFLKEWKKHPVEGKKHIVLFTDARFDLETDVEWQFKKDFYKWLIDTTKECKKQNVTISMFRVGEELDEDEKSEYVDNLMMLNGICDATGGLVFEYYEQDEIKFGVQPGEDEFAEDIQKILSANEEYKGQEYENKLHELVAKRRYDEGMKDIQKAFSDPNRLYIEHNIRTSAQEFREAIKFRPGLSKNISQIYFKAAMQMIDEDYAEDVELFFDLVVEFDVSISKDLATICKQKSELLMAQDPQESKEFEKLSEKYKKK